MMEKYSESFSHEPDCFALVCNTPSFEKKAQHYAEPLLRYVERLTPSDRYVYAVVNALGAGEAVGSNRNGDYFPEEALKQYHNTFVTHGKVYQHHVNKDPKKKLGDILFSYYNDKMRRVELVIALDREIQAAKRVIERLLAGDLVKTSMGARVPFDVCSITGKIQKTRADYSDYCANQINQVLPDGRRVFANNTKPTFFDISIVTIPADQTSYLMDYFNQAEKSSAMVKRIPGSLDLLPDQHIAQSQRALSEHELTSLKAIPLHEALSTLLGLRIIPKPQEFSRIVTAAYGQEQEVDFLQHVNFDNALIPDNIGPEYCNLTAAEVFLPNHDELSLTTPYITARLVKQAQLYPNQAPKPERSWISQAIFNHDEQPITSPSQNPTAMMAGLGAVYAGYLQLFGESATTSGFMRYLQKNPWLAPVIAGSAGLASFLAQESQFNSTQPEDPTVASVDFTKTASLGRYAGTFLVAAPTSYYLSGRAEYKARQGYKVNKTEDFIRRHPFLTSLGATALGGMSLGKLLSKTQKKPVFKLAHFDKINQVFQEII